MKNTMKRTAAALLALALVAGTVPANVRGGGTVVGTAVVASAESEQQEVTEVKALTINDSYYSVDEVTAQDFSVDSTDLSISLNDNVTIDDLSNLLDLSKHENITVNLNGFTLTTNKRFNYHNKIAGNSATTRTLTISGVGNFVSTVSENALMGIYDDNEATYDNYVITFNNGVNVIAADSYAVLVNCANGHKARGITVNVGGGTVSTKATIQSKYGLYVNGNVNVVPEEGAEPVTFNINANSTVKDVNNSEIAIYQAGYSVVNINGGTIQAATAIYSKQGILNISGSPTIKGLGATSGFVPDGNGANATGDAIVVEDNVGYLIRPNVTISGGTIQSTNAKAISAYKSVKENGVLVEDTNPSEVQIYVTGGTFKSGTAAYDVSAYYDTDTFTQDDNGQVVAIATIAYEIINNTTGKKTFGTSTTGQIQIGNETVKLLKDVTPVNVMTSIWASDTNPSVLDLNGYNVTCTSTSRNGFYPRNGHHLMVINTGDNKDASITLNQNESTFAMVSGTGSQMTIGEDVTVNGEIAVFENATLNIYGTVKTTKEDDYAISGNKVQSEGSIINIYEGAVVESTNGIGIYHPQDGTLNITGGTVTGETAVYARTGNINIDGGSFVSTKSEYASPSDNANGATSTGDTLVFQSHPSYGFPVVRITGGDFTTQTGKTVASYSYNGSGMSDISITGGTFSDELDTAFIANGYTQDNGEVKKLEQKDISEFVTLSLIRDKFNYDGTEKYVTYNYITSGPELDKDFVVEGTTSATDVGSYVVKVRGIGDYKGEVTATWTITNSYYVDVTYGDFDYKHYKYSFGQSATVSAPTTYGDDKFSHWSTDPAGDNVVSTSATYSFIVKNQVNLYAIYVGNNVAVEEQAILNLTTFKSTYNGQHAVGFDFTHSVPAGYTVKEVGLLYGTNKLCGANTGVADYKKVNLISDGASVGVSNLENALKTRSTVKKYVASYKKNNGTVRFSYALSDEAYANAIGYITYVDNNKQTVTVYSNVMAASWASMN